MKSRESITGNKEIIFHIFIKIKKIFFSNWDLNGNLATLSKLLHGIHNLIFLLTRGKSSRSKSKSHFPGSEAILTFWVISHLLAQNINNHSLQSKLKKLRCIVMTSWDYFFFWHRTSLCSPDYPETQRSTCLCLPEDKRLIQPGLSEIVFSISDMSLPAVCLQEQNVHLGIKITETSSY